MSNRNSTNPDVTLNAPATGHPITRTSGSDSVSSSSSSLPSPAEPRHHDSDASLASHISAGIKAFFGLGGSASTAPMHRGPDTAVDKDDDAHDHKAPPEIAGEGKMNATAGGPSNSGAGGAAGSPDAGKLPKTTERGHRGGIVGMESDAKGGNVKLAKGITKDMESIFGIKKKTGMGQTSGEKGNVDE